MNDAFRALNKAITSVWAQARVEGGPFRCRPVTRIVDSRYA